MESMSLKPKATFGVSAIMAEANDREVAAVIRPFEFTDEATGDTISVSVSPLYSMISVNRRTYYFRRETGEFDGTATTYREKGPIAI